MSVSEVEAILGGPPNYDFYSKGNDDKVWMGSDFRIQIRFDYVTGPEPIAADGGLYANDGRFVAIRETP